MSFVTTISLDLITVSAILLLTALGLFVIFGLMGIVNLAHGEFIMLGAYASIITVNLGLSPWLTLIIAPIGVGIFGLLIERILIRHLYGKIMESILATWGLSIIIIQFVEMIFGQGYQAAVQPIQASVSIFGSAYPLYRLFIVGMVVLLLFILLFIERKTSLGINVRAVIENPSLASAWGININRTYQLTFVFGSALAGLTGAIIAPIVTVFPSMGMSYVINAFLTVLTGGVNTSLAIVGSSFLLGGTKNVFEYLFNAVWGNIALVMVAIIFMRLRETRI